MANHANKTTNLVPVYGIIISVVAIVLSIIFYVTNYYDTLWTGFMIGAVIFIGVLLSVINYNSNHHERTNAAAMFGMGFRTTIFSVIVISVFAIIFHLIATSGTHAMPTAANNGDQVAGQGNFWIYFLGQNVFMNMTMGVLAAALAAFVFKRNQTTPSAH